MPFYRVRAKAEVWYSAMVEAANKQQALDRVEQFSEPGIEGNSHWEMDEGLEEFTVAPDGNEDVARVG